MEIFPLLCLHSYDHDHRLLQYSLETSRKLILYLNRWGMLTALTFRMELFSPCLFWPVQETWVKSIVGEKLLPYPFSVASSNW